MTSLTLRVREMPIPAELIRFTPVGSSRAIYRIRCAAKMAVGESCRLLDGAGNELECFVTNVERFEEAFIVDLRCIWNDAFGREQQTQP